ncbi:MAG: hypothetical protein JW996_07365, partial [Candidatus Cloacimonetes bacterium]|nr:hypothetical protein [Candidatus Cloacimonadota bacterium]
SADYLDLQMIIPDSLNLLITLPVNITVDNRSEKLTLKEPGIYQLGSDHNLQIELNQETGSVSFSAP